MASHPDEIIHLISRCTAENPCRVCQPIPANTTVTSPASMTVGGGRHPAPTGPQEGGPDLLYACITAVEVLQPMLSPCESDCECVLHLLDAAIAKAQGAA